MTYQNLLDFIGANAKTFPILGGRSEFAAQILGQHLEVQLSSGSRYPVDEVLFCRVLERYMSLAPEHRRKASLYTMPGWVDCPNMVVSPAIAAIIDEFMGSQKRATVTSTSTATSFYSSQIETYLARNPNWKADLFPGPPLHYHLTSLGSRNCCDAFARESYGMLVAWGMNRLGEAGPSMKRFEIYKESLNQVWPWVCQVRQYNLCDADLSVIRPLLEKIFLGLDVMNTKSILVAHSKVMHHALPNLVPPVDRTYTLEFLKGSSRIPEDRDEQFELFMEMLGLFQSLICPQSNKAFREKLETYLEQGTWNSSNLKILDNLIILSIKARKKGNN